MTTGVLLSATTAAQVDPRAAVRQVG